MKKKIGILLVLVLLLSAFAAGCGGQADEPGEVEEDLSLAKIQDKHSLVLNFRPWDSVIRAEKL